MFKRARRLGLALQGGGAHGAFTWGVLDALLEHHRFGFEAASATSAGAINAVALAQGLLDGGPEGARAALARLWGAIGTQVPFELFTTGQGESLGLSPQARALLHLTRYLSPAQLNPLGLNPLRDLLETQIDFERLRAASPLRLFIAATHANSGRLRLFGERELSVQAVLASTCLPTLHAAVEIDGEPYWDGAYSANPALFPLLCDCRCEDVLLVLLAPLEHARTPLSAAEIQERAVEIGFNATLLREIGLLAQAGAFAAGSWWPAGALERRLLRLRWHLIEAQDLLGSLRGETRLIAHLPFLEHLRDRGRERALQWLDAGAEAVGRRSGIDLGRAFGPRPRED